MKKEQQNSYEDILFLPHHTSETHPRMPMAVRAAQFSPFAALTGYEAAVKERGRQTEAQIEWDECVKAELDRKLGILKKWLEERESVDVTLTYFQPDSQKEGGSYCQITGPVTRIDGYRRVIVLRGEEAISMDQICSMDSEVFSEME